MFVFSDTGPKIFCVKITSLDLDTLGKVAVEALFLIAFSKLSMVVTVSVLTR